MLADDVNPEADDEFSYREDPRNEDRPSRPDRAIRLAAERLRYPLLPVATGPIFLRNPVIPLPVPRTYNDAIGYRPYDEAIDLAWPKEALLHRLEDVAATFGVDLDEPGEHVKGNDGIRQAEGVLQREKQGASTDDTGAPGCAKGDGVYPVSGEGRLLPGLPSYRPGDQDDDNCRAVQRDVGLGPDRAGVGTMRTAVRELPPETAQHEVLSDAVHHPSHYTSHPSGVECIDVTEHMNFNLGNVVKYVWRAGLKGDTLALEDLKKGLWYLNREIGRLSS